MYLSPRWIIFLGIFLVLCTLVANIIEEAAPLSSESLTIFSIVQDFSQLSSSDTAGALTLIMSIAPKALELLFKMLIWDYNFLNSFVGVIIKLIMWCISFAILLWLVIAFVKR
jgi:hypothetical protein